MKYYSTNHNSPDVTAAEAIVKGLAPDRGLYMPEHIERLPREFFDCLGHLSFQEIARVVARAFFGSYISHSDVRRIVENTLSFPTPVVKVEPNIYSLELFHGPTLAFKDVGARFMSRMLRQVLKDDPREIHVLVATSGDTGSAVANGFYGVEGIKVHVLYPKGKVSPIQECQFTTLGGNITAIEVDGTFDDCQRLVKSAFLDEELNKEMLLTSANSINIARFLPQTFYYFNAYAQLKRHGEANEVVFSVPSGNFGNLTAGLVAHRMGLPIKRFIAANNANDVFHEYLKTGVYTPRTSKTTLANAMDVGDPSNFARVLDLYGHDHGRVTAIISGATCSDAEICATMKDCYEKTGYVLDPHGACAYSALKKLKQPGETGVFLATAHPAKFRETVKTAIGKDPDIPTRLAAFMKGKKQSVEMPADYASFKSYLSKQQN